MKQNVTFQGYKYALLVLLCTLFSSTLFGQTAVWTNGGGDNLWSNSANWSTGSIPNGTKSVLFDSTSTDNCILTANVSIRSLSIDSTYTGQVNLGSGDVNTRGIYVHNSTQLDAGTSTINFYNTGTINSPAPFYNLKFQQSGGFYVTIGQNLTVNNELRIEMVHTIRGDTIFVKGDLVTNESQWFFDNITPAHIMLIGNADQTISGSGTLHNLDIQKTGGDVFMGGNVNLRLGPLTGSGAIKNGGGKLIAGNGASFDFSGTIEDLHYWAFTSVGLGQNLNVENLTHTSGTSLSNYFRILVSEDLIINNAMSHTVNLVGTGDQTISGTSSHGRVVINKPSGNVLYDPGFSKTFQYFGVKGYEWDLNGDTLSLVNLSTANFNAFDGGTIKGTGVLDGDLIIADGGFLNTGSSPGCLTVMDDYILQTGGTHIAELEGTTACTGYDQLQVSGNVSLSGDLDVRIGGGYNPINTTDHHIITCGSQSGSFGSINANNSYNATATYSSTQVTIHATPPVFFDVDFAASPICASETEWLVPITVGAAASDVGAVSLLFDYDATKMTYDAVHSFNANLTGADATNSGTLFVNDNNGKISVSWAGNPGATLANDTILTLRFVPANSAANFTTSAGTTADFTWDNTTAGSNELADAMATIMNVNFNDQLAVNIENAPMPTLSSSGATICAGETITFTATGGATYRFLVDGVEVQAASADDTYDTDSITSGQTVTVEVTNANGCSATSTGITVTVNPLPTPTLISSDNDSEICTGESVTFTASGADEYIFQVDGATVQAQSATATFTTTSLTDGQVVSVIGVNTTTVCQAAADTAYTITVMDCYEYSGEVVYKNTDETKMGNVVLTLTEAGGMTYNDTTSVTAGSIGSFSFTDLPGGSYTLTSSNTKTHGGINSTDALGTILHAINIAPLTGINQTAANVNGTGGQTAADALLIQRRFTGLDSSFAAGDWAFGDPSFTLSGDVINQKIYTLAVGDVNGSYTPNPTENTPPTVFFVDGDNIEINDGDNVTIPVRVSDPAMVGAISLVINYQGMTINDITLPNGQNVIYKAANGEMRISWVNLAALNLSRNEVMFNIEATIEDAALVSNSPMTLNPISEIADDIATTYNLIDLVVPTFSTISTNTNTIVEEVLGVRHFPNPFKESVTIQYDLPTTSEVTITVTNALGVQVRNIVQTTQVAGQQQVKFKANDLASGAYFYTITVNDGNNQYQVTKQLMLIK